MCQISRQSDNAFAFYSSFCKCAKRGRKIRRKKKTKKLSQFLKSHISGMPEAISLKFGMWSTEVGGNVHSKICLVSSRQHRATEVRKLRFLSSCQYTHGVVRRLLGPHDTLPCVLIFQKVKCMCCINLWPAYCISTSLSHCSYDCLTSCIIFVTISHHVNISTMF